MEIDDLFGKRFRRYAITAGNLRTHMRDAMVHQDRYTFLSSASMKAMPQRSKSCIGFGNAHRRRRWLREFHNSGGPLKQSGVTGMLVKLNIVAGRSKFFGEA